MSELHNLSEYFISLLVPAALILRKLHFIAGKDRLFLNGVHISQWIGKRRFLPLLAPGTHSLINPHLTEKRLNLIDDYQHTVEMWLRLKHFWLIQFHIPRCILGEIISWDEQINYERNGCYINERVCVSGIRMWMRDVLHWGRTFWWTEQSTHISNSTHSP